MIIIYVQNDFYQLNNRPMKKIYTILLLAIFSLSAFTQQIEIFEGISTINEKPVSSWNSNFKDDIDLVRKSFIRFAKDKYDIKAKKGEKKNLILEQATLPDISDKRGDLYAVFTSENKQTKLGVAFFIGYDIPVNKQDNPVEMEKLKQFHKEFILYYKTEYFNTLIAENQKRIKELSSDLKKNQKELKSLSRSISKAEKSISKESDEDVKFELNNQNIEARARTQAIHEIISNIKVEINRVSSSLKDINKSLKDLENEGFKE